MTSKILTYEGHFEATDEPRLQIVDRRDLHMFGKYASEDVRGFMSKVEPVPGKTTLLVLAMSAGEHYGPNRNGDGFSERPVQRDGAWLVRPGQELPKHYQTFENGHVFRHHINKDPAKAIGEILKAFYNEIMHRVELLIQVDNKKGGHMVSQVEDGQFPGVSMGCRIPFDVCSVCGNKAPTRAEYCQHVNGLDPRYGMNRLLEDGQRCFVWNPDPFFFDLSEVFRPADRIGYTLQKVAYTQPYEVKLSVDLGSRADELGQKAATLDKVSIIDKTFRGIVTDPEVGSTMSPAELRALDEFVHGVVQKAAASMPMIDVPTLAKLADHPFPVVFSTMNALGMVPSTKEAFVMTCLQDGVNPPIEAIEAVGLAQGKVAAALAECPEILDHVDDLLVLDERLIDEKVAKILLPWREKRALYKEYLARQHLPESYGSIFSGILGFDPNQAYFEPTQTPLHYQDPTTGRVYQTTRRVAEKTDWANTKKELMEGAGLAGLLGAGVKTLTANKKWRWLTAPAWLGAGLLGSHIYRRQKMPDVKTLEGVDVPANVEFVEKRGGVADVLAPIGGGGLLTFLLAQDYRRDPYGNQLGRVAWEHPALTTVGTTGLGAGAWHLGKKLLKRGSWDPMDRATSDLASAVRHLGEIALDQLIAPTDLRR